MVYRRPADLVLRWVAYLLEFGNRGQPRARITVRIFIMELCN
jgi:hypothetical protein